MRQGKKGTLGRGERHGQRGRACDRSYAEMAHQDLKEGKKGLISATASSKSQLIATVSMVQGAWQC